MVCGLSAIVAGQVTAPRKIKDVRPVYPREALEAGDEGVVLLELNVTDSGTVEQARILWSQCTRLEQAAVTAARQWQYAQVRVNGEPMPFTVVADVPSDCPHDSRSERVVPVRANGKNHQNPSALGCCRPGALGLNSRTARAT